MNASRHPIAGVDYPRTHQELVSWFADEESCLEYLESVRWPDGFVCPHCESTSAWRISRRGMWMCARCGKQTSVTAGTIFHRSHTPLTTWFSAIWFICSSKNGVSAATLQQILGFGSYETAWAWLHKLRRAMVRPDRDLLAGTVELEKGFIGGLPKKSEGGKRVKIPVMIAVEITPSGTLGRARLQRAKVPNSNELLDFASLVIEPGSHIKTDGARNLRRLSDLGFEHEYRVMVSSPDPAHIFMPGVHKVASLLKRWVAGTLHYGMSKRQLDYYLDEFTFRFNRRSSKSRGLLFYRLVQQAANTDPHPLTSLIGGNKPFH